MELITHTDTKNNKYQDFLDSKKTTKHMTTIRELLKTTNVAVDWEEMYHFLEQLSHYIEIYDITRYFVTLRSSAKNPINVDITIATNADELGGANIQKRHDSINILYENRKITSEFFDNTSALATISALIKNHFKGSNVVLFLKFENLNP
jgi:hypothetical protein